MDQLSPDRLKRFTRPALLPIWLSALAAFLGGVAFKYPWLQIAGAVLAVIAAVFEWKQARADEPRSVGPAQHAQLVKHLQRIDLPKTVHIYSTPDADEPEALRRSFERAFREAGAVVVASQAIIGMREGITIYARPGSAQDAAADVTVALNSVGYPVKKIKLMSSDIASPDFVAPDHDLVIALGERSSLHR